jgi:hypothetical protein
MPVRPLLAGGAIVALLAMLGSPPAEGHEFNAPIVTVAVSKLEARGHPDIRTTIDLYAGEPFERVEITSPPGSGIAADADIPDGTVVGRLDGESTTNAITGPECNVSVSFSVPIVEATADINSPFYPAYLRDVYPGQHRLRLVADLSPSPEIPVFINYLFDVEALDGPIINDPGVGQVVSRVVIGDPSNPPAQFRTCTPLRSVNYLFGMTPAGTPLITSPDPLPSEPLPFEYIFTSRPDASGERHTQVVTTTAAVDDFGPPPLPAPPAPQNLALMLFGTSGRLTWEYEGPADQFEVQFTLTEAQGQNSTYPFFLPGSVRSFDFDEQFVPRCGGPRITYGVQAHVSGRPGLLEQIGPYDGCVIPADDTGVIGAPDAGVGPSSDAVPWHIWLAMIVPGAMMIASGAVLRRGRRADWRRS